eukprot:TRINITY_DN75251_c0_g1_i1.p1 TRINITY_DN75251_c0_g1~~TRINITY_DN75251_c0_g1_i1.p1  ORF type:complete len:153 (-),score=33.54 TRINITY_DN75251_c0_g1_i1:346-804(-)
MAVAETNAQVDAEASSQTDATRESIVDAMECWLASDDFDSAWRECYDRACRGSGRSDRNISGSVLLETAIALHGSLPDGVLEGALPEPDAEFISGAMRLIGVEDPWQNGLQDLECFEAALVVVYTHLAHCAETLRKQFPGMQKFLAAGVLPP